MKLSNAQKHYMYYLNHPITKNNRVRTFRKSWVKTNHYFKLPKYTKCTKILLREFNLNASSFRSIRTQNRCNINPRMQVDVTLTVLLYGNKVTFNVTKDNPTYVALNYLTDTSLNQRHSYYNKNFRINGTKRQEYDNLEVDYFNPTEEQIFQYNTIMDYDTNRAIVLCTEVFDSISQRLSVLTFTSALKELKRYLDIEVYDQEP